MSEIMESKPLGKTPSDVVYPLTCYSLLQPHCPDITTHKSF
jgi:uncharacterized protein (UPF0303 family)